MGMSQKIYNSRNYYRLLNILVNCGATLIYNSRNYYRLLNQGYLFDDGFIYNSRNYYRLLNDRGKTCNIYHLQQ